MKVIVDAIKLKYDLDIENKLTIISDLSATGKTTLLNLVEEYNNQSGIVEIKSELPCYVINSELISESSILKNKYVFFIDEDMEFIKTYEFYKIIMESEGYFVIVGRNPEIFLDYSIDSIFTIKLNEGVHKLENKYNIRELSYKYCKNNLKKMVNEGSGSGFEFYDKITSIENKSAKGNRNILKLLDKEKEGIFTIDRLGYGKYISILLNKIETNGYKVQLNLQNSFEYVILMSGILGNDVEKLKRIEKELKNTNLNLEKFFYEYLVEITSKNIERRYKKSKISDWYLKDENVDKICKALEKDSGFRLEDYIKDNDFDLKWSNL